MAQKITSRSYSKKLLLAGLILYIALFLTSFTSALDFDNIQTYNPETRTYTIENWLGLGEILAEIKLTSELNVVVPRGYQKVAEFELFNFKRDYNNAFKDMNFYEANDLSKEISRTFDYKYLDYEWEEQKVYETVCETKFSVINQTNYEDCRQEQINTKNVLVPIWIKFSDVNELPNNASVTIGIFTEVLKDDYVEWIPTFFGERLTEWATWTEGMSVGIFSYYKMEETAGNFQDATPNNNNCTVAGNLPTRVGGKIDFGQDFDGTGDYCSAGDVAEIDDGVFTINFWFNPDAIDNNYQIVSKNTAGDSGFRLFEKTGNVVTFEIQENANEYTLTGSDKISISGWNMITILRRANGTAELYINGTKDAGDDTTTWKDTAQALGIGGIVGGLNVNGQFDEVMISDRDWSASEITDLWNGGSGLQYIEVLDDNPNITLNSPSSTNYTTLQNLQINFTAWDDFNLTSVKLYVNDVLNQTNVSGINNTNYLFNLPMGDGNYTIYGKATDNESQETNSSSIVIQIDTTPNIQYTANTEIDHFNSTTSYLPIEVTLTETYFDTISFNVDGTVTNYTDGTRLYNVSNADGTYTYNATVYTTTGKSNITATRTINIDTTFPTINISTPAAVNGYISIGDNETLNVTITDTNLDSCWYNYNGTNITISGCLTTVLNSTDFTIESGVQNITVYANDTFGHENSTTSSWVYNLTENSQTYPTSSVESAVETYVANLTYNNSLYNIITGSLYLNETSYTGTRTGSTTSAIFTTSPTMPSLVTETNFTAYWTISLTNVDGTMDYNLTSHNVTVSPVNFSLCDATNNVSFWNFTVFNESNLVEINSTFEGTFTITLTGSSVENVFSFSDTTGTNSTFDFCISPGTESYTINTNIKLTKVGYVDKFYNYENIIVTNSTKENNLYMMITDDSTSFIIHALYDYGEDLIGAEIKVQRYYPGTDEWLTTEILTTNDDGEAIGHFLSEDADYRFQVSVVGINIYNSSSTKIVCATAPCTVTLIIPVSFLTGYETVENLETTLTYSSTTNIFTYTYSDTSTILDNARLWVTRIFPSNATTVSPCNETKITDSGVITCDITGEVNGTYMAIGYITRDEDEFVSDIIYGSIGTNFYSDIGEDGILWGFFIIIAITMLGITRPSMAIIFGIMSLIFVSLLGIVNVGVVSIVAVLAIGIILLMRIGRE